MKPCIIHPNKTNKLGYVPLTRNRKGTKAHRVAYCEANNLTLADIEGVTIRHSCDVRNCIEPTHLLSGTQTDNMQDMSVRKRSAKLTATAEEILSMAFLASEGATQCDIALYTGYSQSHVSLALRGKLQPRNSEIKELLL